MRIWVVWIQCTIWVPYYYYYYSSHVSHVRARNAQYKGITRSKLGLRVASDDELLWCAFEPCGYNAQYESIIIIIITLQLTRYHPMACNKFAKLINLFHYHRFLGELHLIISNAYWNFKKNIIVFIACCIKLLALGVQKHKDMTEIYLKFLCIKFPTVDMWSSYACLAFLTINSDLLHKCSFNKSSFHPNICYILIVYNI